MSKKLQSFADLGSVLEIKPKQEKSVKLEMFETETKGLLVFINNNEKFMYMDKEGNFRRGGVGKAAKKERTWFNSWDRKTPAVISKEMKETVLKYSQEKTFSM